MSDFLLAGAGIEHERKLQREVVQGSIRNFKRPRLASVIDVGDVAAPVVDISLIFIFIAAFVSVLILQWDDVTGDLLKTAVFVNPVIAEKPGSYSNWLGRRSILNLPRAAFQSDSQANNIEIGFIDGVARAEIRDLFNACCRKPRRQHRNHDSEKRSGQPIHRTPSSIWGFLSGTPSKYAAPAANLSLPSQNQLTALG